MKFIDIEVGQTVYIRYEVSGDGWRTRSYGRFFLPKKVTKVTNKFFDADDKRFSKDNGLQRISGYGVFKAYKEGDIVEGIKVECQSKEYEKAVLLQKKVKEASSLICSYIINNKVWSVEDLDALITLLNKNKG